VKGTRLRATVGTYYAVSYDGGDDFTAPAPITAARWFPAGLALDANGAGLRERADFGSDGIVRYAYGDGRLAATYPGRSAVYVALVDTGLRFVTSKPRTAVRPSRGLLQGEASPADMPGGDCPPVAWPGTWRSPRPSATCPGPRRSPGRS